MKKIILVSIFWGMLISCNSKPTQTGILDEMKICVPSEANRAVSFTNKHSAYYYTQSHENNHEEWAWFEGLNIAKQKMFHGYELFDGESKIDNKQAEVWVYPYKMVRKHDNGMTETFQMFDNLNIIEIALEKAPKGIGLNLKGDNVIHTKIIDHIALFQSMEGHKVIAVSSINDKTVKVESDRVYSNCNGFLISVGGEDKEARALIDLARRNNTIWKKERKDRIRNLLLENTLVKSDNDSLQLAMNWIVTTMNQLVTQQQGQGIYAGLPWFNEYWGRDEFIALPGACLVSGQFDWARNILKSFAEYQETDPNSKFFGRVPNIVNPALIDYHTTDGTPRFVHQLQEYVKYSGDTTIIEELYDNVKYSIEGSLKNWTDEDYYLIHAENETWMDARRQPDLAAYSPRDNRANDIQALWFNQLNAGVYFANYMKDTENAEKWQKIANNVKSNFAKDYTNIKYNYLADRLTENGVQDFKIRPNQLFALDMIEDQELKWKATRICWEELVYPWGVASLNRQDDFFHPFHGAWEHYHKDEAYHNGTVWLWNNGIAMQRMIEAGQSETAYKLFKNMNWQALTKGCVGGMCENMDAYPQVGKSWPKITGTYLQAWSNSEHLRTWYQYFLGVQPDMINTKLSLKPMIPAEINSLEYLVLVGKGKVKATYKKSDVTKYTYTFNDLNVVVHIDIFPYETVNIESLTTPEITLIDTGKELMVGNEIFPVSPKKLAERKAANKLFEGTEFCKPMDLSKHPVMKQVYVRE
ncbi:MAG: hypothetical protein JXQ65_13625 [Candidatus Marinimicrobia bacterium]|nr:hypothetical protein [Candidatus Neomarinimicrobiota bacterium]